MAGRKARYDAEYFPFLIKEGKTFTILQQKFGNSGMGFFTNLMRLLTRTPHHFVVIEDDVDEMYFWAQCGTDASNGLPVLELLIKTGKIDKELWGLKIVCCPDLIDSLKNLYSKRINPITEVHHIHNWAKKCSLAGISVTGIEFPVSEIHKVSKVSKVSKESISVDKNIIFEFFYFKNYKNPKSETERFFDYYKKTGGCDKNGNKIEDFMSAAKFWKPKEQGIHTPPDLLLKWRKAFDAYYKIVSLEEEDDPLMLNVYVKALTSIDLTLKTAKTIEWKIRKEYQQNFTGALFIGFGKVNIVFNNY